MDFSTTHSIVNDGKSDRVHLIIDGIRNSWTDQLFEQHGYHINDRQYDDLTQAGMIAELERMNTDVARAIIVNLKLNNTLPNDLSVPPAKLDSH